MKVGKLLYVGVAAACLWLVYRYFFQGDQHPLNWLMGLIGVRPVFLELSDMTWFSPLLEMLLSIGSAIAFYFGVVGVIWFGLEKIEASSSQ